MDLADPLSTIAPSIHTRILLELWRTTEPMSGRAVARRLEAHGSRPTVDKALRELVSHGVVTRADRPPVSLYELNREHVAAEVLPLLATLRQRLWDRMRANVAASEPRPLAVYLFGSAARGEARSEADIDVLVVYVDSPDAAAGEPAEFELAERVRRWAGNDAQIVSLTRAELAAAAREGQQLIGNLERDAIALHGPPFSALIRQIRDPVRSPSAKRVPR